MAQERETLERLREELEREKERISSTALRLKTRTQEVEAFSRVNINHTYFLVHQLVSLIFDGVVFFAACGREARGRRTSAAGGKAHGGRAQSPAHKHPCAGRAAEATGAANPTGLCSTTFK